MTWKGEINLASETSGSVAFRYVNLPEIEGKEQHQFGLKNVIIRDNENEEYIYVYLIGNKLDGYGKEVLIRKRG